jgi:hypothetical protein
LGVVIDDQDLLFGHGRLPNLLKTRDLVKPPDPDSSTPSPRRTPGEGSLPQFLEGEEGGRDADDAESEKEELFEAHPDLS